MIILIFGIPYKQRLRASPPCKSCGCILQATRPRNFQNFSSRGALLPVSDSVARQSVVVRFEGFLLAKVQRKAHRCSLVLVHIYYVFHLSYRSLHRDRVLVAAGRSVISISSILSILDKYAVSAVKCVEVFFFFWVGDAIDFAKLSYLTCTR